MTDEYYKTGKLQLHLEKLNMTVSVTGIEGTCTCEPQCMDIMFFLNVFVC